MSENRNGEVFGGTRKITLVEAWDAIDRVNRSGTPGPLTEVALCRIVAEGLSHLRPGKPVIDARDLPSGVCVICHRWRDYQGRCGCRGNNVGYAGMGEYKP